jgi:hypothetical protein
VWHRQRLSGGFKQALAELTDGGGALRHLNKLAYEAICYKMKDPERAAKEFSLKDLAALYLNSAKLDAQIRGDASTRREGARELQPSVINEISVNLPEGYIEKMKEKQTEMIEGEIVDAE